MHAYNLIFNAMATIEPLLQLFLFMCELQIKPFVLENQVFDTPARNGSVPLATDKGSSPQYYESWRENESWNSHLVSVVCCAYLRFVVIKSTAVLCDYM